MMYIEIALKLLIGMLGLLVVVRLLGKKDLGEFTPFDIIYTLVLGGIVEESLFDDKVKVHHLVFALILWALAIFIIEYIAKRSEKARILLKGEPAIIISAGKFNLHELKKNQLEMEQIRTMLRQQGIFSLREIRDLYIEPGGTVSINKYAKYNNVTAEMLNLEPKQEIPSHLLIDEGEINEASLKNLGKNHDWLVERLQEEGYSKIESIIYCEWSEVDGFFLKSYDESIDQ
ncbi:DUF421 domain-containing protein [Chungangia koreensis]|uniref:DUF421 domain-containing protein n=1 Tax=Chungangia koreensis TaxID=752657 RepID=A0ABV8X5W4_9LACT